MLVCMHSIPAFLWLEATHHIVERLEKVTSVWRGGKKAEQTGEGAEDSGLQQEHKTQLTGELLVFQGRECKEGWAESAGGIREVGANSKIVEERECVSTGSWESFKLNLQSNHQMSEARILHSSNSQGTKRDRHINRFQGFGFECIFTHTPLHKSQLDLQNSTELKQAWNKGESYWTERQKVTVTNHLPQIIWDMDTNIPYTKWIYHV